MSGLFFTGPAIFSVKDTSGRPYCMRSAFCRSTRRSRAASICESSTKRITLPYFRLPTYLLHCMAAIAPSAQAVTT